jgi:hypothetical protein
MTFLTIIVGQRLLTSGLRNRGQRKGLSNRWLFSSCYGLTTTHPKFLLTWLVINQWASAVGLT